MGMLKVIGRASVWLLAAVSTACATPLQLGVDTTYVIEDLDPETLAHLEKVLRREADSYGFTVLHRSTEEGRFEFRLSRVRDVSVLGRVQSVILDVGVDARVPLVLQEASLRFASVQGRGSTQIQVVGTATPGADVLIDQGSEIRTVRVDSSGQWTTTVDRTPRLRDRGGWIYGLVIKGNARQYIEMNVLDGGESRAIDREDLPRDCPLRHR